MKNSKIMNTSLILIFISVFSNFFNYFLDLSNILSDILSVICVVSGLGAAAIGLHIVIDAIKENRREKQK